MPTTRRSPGSVDHVLVLAGGVGGSRFVTGVLAAFPQARVDVVGNTADDITMHGLRICPDLDTMTYALGDANDTQRGWGRADEGWRVMEELRAFGAEPTWFALGDRDLATHLVRTQLLASGMRLTEVTERVARRWLPDRVHLLPMSDDPVETHVLLTDGRRVHFQEFWVRLHAEPEVAGLDIAGLADARPTPEVLAAIETADLVLIAPSNPVVSIGPVLGVPGLRDALLAHEAPILGFSGIIGGAPVLGMAHRLLPAIGVEVSALGVGLHYGARERGGLLDAWLVHETDADALAGLRAAGLTAQARPLLMSSPEATAAFIHDAAALL